jgi:hypothetical protein
LSRTVRCDAPEPAARNVTCSEVGLVMGMG